MAVLSCNSSPWLSSVCRRSHPFDRYLKFFLSFVLSPCLLSVLIELLTLKTFDIIIIG